MTLQEISKKRRRTASTFESSIHKDNVAIDSDDDVDLDDDFETMQEEEEEDDDAKEVDGIQGLKKKAHPSIRSVVHYIATKVFTSAKNHNEVFNPLGCYSVDIQYPKGGKSGQVIAKTKADVDLVNIIG
jgi:hypothetical protein